MNSRNYVMDLVTKEAPLEERAVKNGDILPTAEADIRNKDNKNTRKKSKFNGQYEYMKQIYDVMTGKMPSHKTVEVMETPEILKEYGASDLMITIDQKNIRKIAYPTNYLGLKQGHNLSFYALEQLPQQLANPVAIAKSKMPNSLFVFTEFLDADNSPVIAAIHLDKNGNIGVSNEVASVYGKRTFDNMVSDLRNSGEDKKRGLASLPAYGLRLSEVEATTDPIFNIYNSATGFQTGFIGIENSTLPNNIISDADRNYNTDLEKNIDTLPDRLAQNKPVTEHTADESRQIVQRKENTYGLILQFVEAFLSLEQTDLHTKSEPRVNRF